MSRPVCMLFCLVLTSSSFSLGCDLGYGIHCIRGFWDCPQSVFREGVTSGGCHEHCCRVNGRELAKAEHIADGATILINPGQPGHGRCSWCPGGGGEGFKCCDQRHLGLPPPLSRCNKYRPTGCVPAGTSN